MKHVLLASLIFLLIGCSAQFANQDIEGRIFPSVKGTSLSGKEFVLPQAFSGEPVLLLIGYKQKSQFDIDRWLIGLDMKGFDKDVYEIPVIKGIMPRVIRSSIDESMKKGIPATLWPSVITVYQDAEKIQRLTGNINPNNARVVLLDKRGKIRYFYDGGFSVAALNALLSISKSSPREAN